MSPPRDTPTHMSPTAEKPKGVSSTWFQEELQRRVELRRARKKLEAEAEAEMPRNRRPPAIPAAASLSARLPLGTPSFARDTSPHMNHPQVATSTHNDKHSRSTLDGSHDSDGSDLATPRLDSVNSSHSDLVMASSMASDDNNPLSIAAAKLERQNKRIEATNATLTAQPSAPPEKQKQPARSKGKAWKPFDFATDDHDSTRTPIADAPVVESRVNIFRVPSQVGSLSRPISRVSSHTHDSSYSGSERRDSRKLESDDFTMFTGRKESQPTVTGFTEKTSMSHATVEATFIKRDITDVFGNELPGPGFMDGNPGNIDGQLQFIQHPNGDVSAHQWSASRFGWENIGQFSNIRKKIEGQLAADRLKGETAWQSLQQNTLAYFRTVAKQREADMLRLPFGAKEITACLPDTRPPSTAPTGPRRITSKVEMPERPSTMMSRQETQSSQASIVSREGSAAMPPQPASEPKSRSQAMPPQLKLDTRLDPARYFSPTPRENTKEEPLVATNSFQQYNYGHPIRNLNQHMANYPSHQPWANPMPMYYEGYPMPNASYAPYSYIPHAPRPFFEQSHADDLSEQASNLRLGQPPQVSQPSVQQNQHQVPQQTQPAWDHQSPDRPKASAETAIYQPDQAAGAPVQTVSSASSKQTSPLDTRIAMREHVMKMGEQAKERTKSQANIGRTVLYDPFQDQQQREPTPPEPVKEVKQETLPVSASHGSSLGHFPHLGLNTIPGLSPLSGRGQDPFPTTLAPSVKMPFNATSALSENDLRDSSPDREWQRGTAAEATNEYAMQAPHTSSLKQWDADSLDAWLWSGNKFARQEDFHQRIKASDATPIRRRQSTNATASANIRPIAPPARTNPSSSNGQSSTTDPQSNILTNRLLVPVLENLASYVQGPIEKRRDYFCQWVKAPDWAIDRSATGNDSFFDTEWGQPPARLGRDPRYQPVPRGMDVRFGSNHDALRTGHTVAMPGLGARFGMGGRF